MEGNRWIQLANGHASIGWSSIKGGDNAASFSHYASIMIARLNRPVPPDSLDRQTVNHPRRTALHYTNRYSLLLLHTDRIPILRNYSRCTFNLTLWTTFISLIILKINPHTLIRNIYKRISLIQINPYVIILRATWITNSVYQKPASFSLHPS